MVYSLKIDEELCNGCGCCVIICPIHASKIDSGIPEYEDFIIQVKNGMAFVLNSELCDGCGDCLEICPQDAIELITEKITPGTALMRVITIGAVAVAEEGEIVEEEVLEIPDELKNIDPNLIVDMSNRILKAEEALKTRTVRLALAPPLKNPEKAGKEIIKKIKEEPQG